MSSDRGRFHLASIQQAHGVIIRACGEFIVGHGAAETLWTPHVKLATRGAVMLDLARVTDIDARGLGVLAWLVRHSADRSVASSVVAASQIVATLAGLTRLDRVLQGAWDNRVGAAPDCFARLMPESRAAVDRPHQSALARLHQWRSSQSAKLKTRYAGKRESGGRSTRSSTPLWMPVTENRVDSVASDIVNSAASNCSSFHQSSRADRAHVQDTT
jgi:ABC-type transporter Mla MlaB component